MRLVRATAKTTVDVSEKSFEATIEQE